MPGIFDLFSFFIKKWIVNNSSNLEVTPFVQRRFLQTKSLFLIKHEYGGFLNDDVRALFRALGPTSHEIIISGPNLVGVITGKLPNGCGISLTRDLGLDLIDFKKQKDSGIALHLLDINKLKFILTSESLKKGYSTCINNKIIIDRLFEISDQINNGDTSNFNVKVRFLNDNLDSKLSVDDLIYI